MEMPIPSRAAAVASILTVLILSEGSMASKFTARNRRRHSGLWIFCSDGKLLCLPYGKSTKLHPEPEDMMSAACDGVYKRSCEQFNLKAEPKWKYFTVFELDIDDWRCRRSSGCEFEGREDGWYLWNPEARIWDRLRQALEDDRMQNYEVGIPALVDDGIKLLVYAGEYDLIMCNWLGNSRWVRSMKWSGQKDFVSSAEIPFMVDGTKAGVLKSHGALSFLKVHRAGHMVPLDQPKAALEMLKRWMQGKL